MKNGCEQIREVFAEPENLFVVSCLARIFSANPPEKRRSRSMREIQEGVSEIPGVNLHQVNKSLLDMLVAKELIKEIVPDVTTSVVMLPGIEYEITKGGIALVGFLQNKEILKFFGIYTTKID